MTLLNWLRCPFCEASVYGVTTDHSGELGSSTGLGLWSDCDHTPLSATYEDLSAIKSAVVCASCGSESAFLGHEVRPLGSGGDVELITATCANGHEAETEVARDEQGALEVDWGTDRQLTLADW